MVFVMVVLASVFFLLVDQCSPRGVRLVLGLGADAMTARWYVVHVYSGFEKKVAESISEQAEQKGLGEKFEEVLVPTEEVVEVQRGAKVNAERKFFPGYVLVKMDLTDESLASGQEHAEGHGLPGRQGPARADHRGRGDRIIRQVQEGIERPKPSITFEIGEQVRVCDGPFTSFNGLVEEVDEEKARLKVAVSIFGRATPVELEYSQVEKSDVAFAMRREAEAAMAVPPQNRGTNMAKKIVGFIKLQVPAGKANPSPPIGPALGPARPEHHGVLQGVQRPDPGPGTRHADPGGHHRLCRPQLHLRHQDRRPIPIS